MKLSGVKQIRLSKSYLCFGYNFKTIGVGFGINRYNLNLDLLFFWLSWEF